MDVVYRMVNVISIHAPREGGDVAVDMPAGGGEDISIHAPRVGGDPGRRGCLEGHL